MPVVMAVAGTVPLGRGRSVNVVIVGRVGPVVFRGINHPSTVGRSRSASVTSPEDLPRPGLAQKNLVQSATKHRCLSSCTYGPTTLAGT